MLKTSNNFLIFINAKLQRVISQKFKKNTFQIVLSDGRPISNTMKLGIKNLPLFLRQASFLRAVSLRFDINLFRNQSILMSLLYL